jgi:hypothetical protein
MADLSDIVGAGNILSPMINLLPGQPIIPVLGKKVDRDGMGTCQYFNSNPELTPMAHIGVNSIDMVYVGLILPSRV